MSYLDLFKDKKIKVNKDAKIYNGFLGDEYNISLISLLILKVLKIYKAEFSLNELQVIIGNIFHQKYHLNRALSESISNSPNMYEKVSESLVFLEASGFINAEQGQIRVITLSDKGESFLKTFNKVNLEEGKVFKNIITKIKREGPLFL